MADATVAHLSEIVPAVAAAAVILSVAVLSCVTWLCYVELRGGRA